jgi:hypothetical protein
VISLPDLSKTMRLTDFYKILGGELARQVWRVLRWTNIVACQNGPYTAYLGRGCELLSVPAEAAGTYIRNVHFSYTLPAGSLLEYPRAFSLNKTPSIPLYNEHKEAESK